MELISALGYMPHSAPLILSEDADFRHRVELTNGAMFPLGTQVYIKWDNKLKSMWPATIQGGHAVWDVQSEHTSEAVIPNGTRYRLYISYADGTRTNDYLWYSGWSRRMG